ncbi:hypothetical protein AB0G42_21515 [Streptomyces yangpuensis]|uniref:deoxynucleotide monophosphate kinase family protein n=1 Tax=Streptomyces yangpuensis TaxID=1648182 RepID=UPI003415409B
MTYRNVAFIGKARSGKDSAGGRLVKHWNYTRVAFADPLKRMALQLNPYIPTVPGVAVRLESLIADVGWEYAKDTYPEVRRTLQHAGQTVREMDEDFWLNIALRSIDAAAGWNMPVVVTDCRYPNEAKALQARGFMLVRIRRERSFADMTVAEAGQARHSSETALDDFPADQTIINSGTLFHLDTEVDALVMRP